MVEITDGVSTPFWHSCKAWPSFYELVLGQKVLVLLLVNHLNGPPTLERTIEAKAIAIAFILVTVNVDATENEIVIATAPGNNQNVILLTP
eukprot:s3696_g12.t1